MSKLAQAILSSHKEAAARAADFLKSTRNLNLKQAESLELVARVLGVANWQTLHAMAQKGTAPRATPGSEPEPKPPTKKSLKERAKRLSEIYSLEKGWGEHPTHLKEHWANSDSEGDSERDYWAWVVRMLDEDKAMMPWEREVDPDVLVAKAGGIDIDFDCDCTLWIVGSAENDDFYQMEGRESEKEAWADAAQLVKDRTCGLLGKSLGNWDDLSLLNKIIAVRAAFPHVRSDKQGVPQASVAIVPPENQSETLHAEVSVHYHTQHGDGAPVKYRYVWIDIAQTIGNALALWQRKVTFNDTTGELEEGPWMHYPNYVAGENPNAKLRPFEGNPPAEVVASYLKAKQQAAEQSKFYLPK